MKDKHTNQMKNTRNSSFELLRIVCMFLIILHHYFIHGEFIFEGNHITMNEILVNALQVGGKLACDIFILISGYFLIDSKFKIKRAIKLIVQMYVYALGILLIFYGFGLVEFNWKYFIKELFPIFWTGWFVRYYLLMYILSPFTNIMLKSLNKNQYKKLMVILIVIWSVIPTFTKDSFSFSDLDTFLIMYMIGAYFRLHIENANNKEKQQFNVSSKVLLAILVFILIIVSTILLTVIGREFNIEKISNNSNYFSKLNSILVVIDAILIFDCFRNIQFTNNTINYIASSMLGVYLIHDDKIVRPFLWTKISPNVNYIDSNLLIIHAIVKTFVVLIICVIVDKIVNKILNLTIYKCIDK